MMMKILVGTQMWSEIRHTLYSWIAMESLFKKENKYFTAMEKDLMLSYY